MRISDTMKFRQVLANMQTSQRGLAELQAQISSGKRISKPSEDPNAASVIMDNRGKLRAIEQYQRNIGVAISRVETEETVLNQLGDTLSRALQLAVSQASDTATDLTRREVKYEVDNLKNFAVSLGNTRHGQGYLFAGHQADVQPFAADGTLSTAINPTLLDQPHEIEVAAGQKVPTNHNGKQVFLDSKAIQALDDLSAALAANDSDAVRTALDTLTSASEKVQDLLGDVGGRYNHLHVTESSLKEMNLSTRTLQSELEDIDPAESMVALTQRQTALQAAYITTSKILSLSLTDYLR